MVSYLEQYTKNGRRGVIQVAPEVQFLVEVKSTVYSAQQCCCVQLFRDFLVLQYSNQNLTLF
jgi:hypothetical protein